MSFEPSRDPAVLLRIMAALRDPVDGCAWDIEQHFDSIVPYTIEEAYEVADAIERKDMGDLCDELGDLLLQVVFHAQMASEIGAFDFGDVVTVITAKMIRRHLHVFGEASARGSRMAKGAWDRIKAEEKADRALRRVHENAGDPQSEGFLAEVPTSFPPLLAARKLQEKASVVGFDWGSAGPVLDKMDEEVQELRGAVADGSTEAITDELGDLLFAAVNLGRHLNIDPEMALRSTNTKFRRRFDFIERSLAARGSSLEEASLEEMEQLWIEAKRSAPSDL